MLVNMTCSMFKLQNRLPLVVENVSWRRRKVNLQVVPAQTLIPMLLIIEGTYRYEYVPMKSSYNNGQSFVSTV